ncbi:MAG: BBS1 domain-containing protein [Oscillospiraceae bacterium]
MPSPVQLHDVDVKAFLKVLDECKGKVFLVTDEGDRLNLKSKLSQLVGLTSLIEGGKIVEASVKCENPEDETKLFRFNLFGNDGKEPK